MNFLDLNFLAKKNKIQSQNIQHLIERFTVFSPITYNSTLLDGGLCKTGLCGGVIDISLCTLDRTPSYDTFKLLGTL